MLKTLLIIAILSALPIPFMFLLKAIDRKATLAQGYVSGSILNLTVFCMCIASMAEQMAAPGLKPVKAVLILCALEMVCALCVIVIRCVRAKKWLGCREQLGISIISRDLKDKKSRNVVLLLAVSFILWLVGAAFYLRYVPDNAIAMMADINRIDFFGVINGDPMTMLGYYLKNLGGISQANAVCLAIPLSFYIAFVAVMWETAAALFSKDTSSGQGEDRSHKRALCFLAEAVLVVLGDCLYTVPYFVLHGLNRAENILLVLALPLTFAIGLRLYFAEDKLFDKESKKINLIGNYVVLLLCLISTGLLDTKAFALVGLNVIILILLFVGRRYLPWLKSSKS